MIDGWRGENTKELITTCLNPQDHCVMVSWIKRISLFLLFLFFIVAGCLKMIEFF